MSLRLVDDNVIITVTLDIVVRVGVRGGDSPVTD